MMRNLQWLALVAVPTLLNAQATARPAAQPSTRPAFEFSSVVFGNFNMRTDSQARAQNGGRASSRFDMGRAYLTFRFPLGEKTSARVTTDIFQQAGSGYAVRLKYGYLQYDATRNLFGVDNLAALARIGMLQTVVIEHMESFWPRYLTNTAVELNGFFASADVGASSLLTMPKRFGEAYITVTNGTGFSVPENDRFKDIGLRFSFTPFASDSGLFRTFAITPWYYKGWNASAFAGPPNSIPDGLQKDRAGIFVGNRDRKLTFGAELAQRMEELEAGVPPVRVVTDRTSQLVSAFTVLRPMEWLNAGRRSAFSVVARHDQFKLNKSAPVSATNPATRFTVLGASWDLTPSTTLTLDYQGLARQSGSTIIPLDTWFLHWVATF
jgi:hypothetical protein